MKRNSVMSLYLSASMSDGSSILAGRSPIATATPATVEQAARLLHDGQLVAFPTETVYGLGADARNEEAVRAIFVAKRRPADHPLIVHLSDASRVATWARDVPPGAHALAEAFWPGPLTLILPRAPHVCDSITGGQDSVGLRVPSHPIAQALLAAFATAGGEGIAGPSANRFGHVSPTTAAHVAADFADDVAMILDGGRCDVGIESTIVAFSGDRPLLLRPGAIDIDALTRVLGIAPHIGNSTAPRASGSLASHYATRTPALLVFAASLRSEIAQREDRDERVAVLAITIDAPPGFNGVWRRAPSDAIAYAHDLYANLRELDAAQVDAILIEAVPDASAWSAVRDRLVRATHPEKYDDRD
ncbi:MAG TPA: L-threonylcarbamoyladenylate synthase [Casimicrobiaceae bacterium]|nr:L-threonylcarbamoyladenylate synthase [Casimicrobiaceae bacterium]